MIIFPDSSDLTDDVFLIESSHLLIVLFCLSFLYQVMALPLVETIVDCADWSKTVAPFVSQLKTLPGQLAASITDPAALKQLYLDTNPLVSALAFALATAPIFFVVSEITRNYSQVDRVWSILPSIFNAHYCVYAHLLGLETRRIDALLAASCLWSVSLDHCVVP